jgi:hypothetical protein
MLSSLFALLIMEGISRLLLRTDHTHIVNKNDELASMQIDPGKPSAGLKPNFEGRMISSEFDVLIKLDSLGLRVGKKAESDIAGDPLHITILGDSFMFGWGVEFSESFSSRLSQRLNATTERGAIVTLLAVPGTGQISQFSMLKRIQRSKPDIVLLGTYLTNRIASGNDLIENLNESYQNSFREESSNSGPNTKPDFLRVIRRWLINNSNLYRFAETRLGAIVLAKMSNAINIESDPKIMERAWSVTDSLLLSMKKFTENLNAEFVIQYIPNMFDCIKNDSSSFLRLQDICDLRNILLAPNPIDLFRSSKAEDAFAIGDYYYLGDGHWTAKAHQVIAHEMALFLSEKLIHRF